MHRPLLLAAVLVLAPAVPLAAQAPAAVGTALTREDSAGIRAASEDYLIGWYDGDAARMDRALHPDLAKRNVQTQNGRSRLSNMGAKVGGASWQALVDAVEYGLLKEQGE